jgi:hypothetical protein
MSELCDRTKSTDSNDLISDQRPFHFCSSGCSAPHVLKFWAAAGSRSSWPSTGPQAWYRRRRVRVLLVKRVRHAQGKRFVVAFATNAISYHEEGPGARTRRQVRGGGDAAGRPDPQHSGPRPPGYAAATEATSPTQLSTATRNVEPFHPAATSLDGTGCGPDRDPEPAWDRPPPTS